MSNLKTIISLICFPLTLLAYHLTGIEFILWILGLWSLMGTLFCATSIMYAHYEIKDLESHTAFDFMIYDPRKWYNYKLTDMQLGLSIAKHIFSIGYAIFLSLPIIGIVLGIGFLFGMLMHHTYNDYRIKLNELV